MILREILSFCYPQTKTQFETHIQKCCGTVQVTRSENFFSLLQSVCGVSEIRVFTALTVMVIVSRM